MNPYFALKKIILMVFKTWAEPLIATYQEPRRAGTPKGEKIGLSRSKYFCALLQALHGPFSLPELSEVSFSFIMEGVEIKGASPGMIMLWRLQEQFRDVASRASGEFAEILLQEVQHCIDERDDIKGFLLLETLVNLSGFNMIKDRVVEFISNNPEYLTCYIEITAKGPK